MISIMLPTLMMVLVPSTTSPAKLPVAEQSDICISVTSRWSGSIEDTRRITDDPVPQSYRERYGWSGCHTLDKASLIDWQLAFGSEASTTKALRFLADTAFVGMPPPGKFADTLPVTWRAAQHRPTPDAARAVTEAHSRFLFIASQYLRAAEFFRSPALLAAGTHYFSAAMRGLNVFYGGARIAMAEQASAKPYEEFLSTGDINTMRDLEMRYAIAQARISGSVADWTRAGAVVEANLDPAARDAEKIAFNRNDDYCELEEASLLLKTACSSENNLSGRLRAVWVNAGLVAQYTDGKVTPGSVTPSADWFDLAMAVVSITTLRTTSDTVRYDETVDDKVQLRLARAESRFRQSRAFPPSSRDAGMLQYSALTDLENAERLVPVALNPNRFRQIATLYLQIYDAMPAAERRMLSQQARQSSYFRVMLAQLGKVADGS